MKKSAALLLLPAAMTLAACSSPSATEGGKDIDKPNVVVAFYGLEYTAQQIVGDHATVTTLTQPGQDAHDLELKPTQVASVGDADLVMYLKQFQPAVDEAVKQSGNKHVLDAAEFAELLPATGAGHGHDHADDDDHADDHDHGDESEGEHNHDHDGEHDHGDDQESQEDHDHSDDADDDHEGHDHDHGDFDPHYWLDPNRMAKVGQALANQLGKQYPEMKDDLQANAKKFSESMSKIDEEYKTGLAKCERKEFITSHTAFNYLAHNYGMTEIGIAGINPDGEPSPARIAKVQELAKEHGVTTIFFETLTSPAVSKAIAGDLGLKTAVLDPLEGITEKSPGDDYPSIMRANLKALKEANGCK
ncbi:metal ABC transporter substrate-binding protein [uncultured Tessaracoccus sp.]|uniref:metal ABC transporter substrate-binding protein n=1 Tax=uncultured Tessaracoccus sp. TaxID=905023 RepID=UPI002603B62F|nr:metal ABC transporter substrate-binding protein [uncultured Tessaracoccus sp.]